MFTNLRKLFFSRQSEITTETAAEPEFVWVRENFDLDNAAELSPSELLLTLRNRTIKFSDLNDLTWAATDFILGNLEIRVKLTETQDIVYTINGQTAFSLKDACELVQTEVVQF